MVLTLRLFRSQPSEFSLEFCEDVGVGVIWEELLTTSKLPCSTFSKIKGMCLLKSLIVKCLKYTGENTATMKVKKLDYLHIKL